MKTPLRLRRTLLGGIAALACSGVAPAWAAEAGKLLIWINGDKGYNGIARIGEEFTKKTGIPVTVEHPADATAKFQQAAAAGKGPDIWIWAHDRLGEWVASGLLQPIAPSRKIVEDNYPLGWKAFTLGGKTWGYPISMEAVSLVYNKDLVSSPPKTFEEIPALNTKLAAKGKRAILWDNTNTYYTWPLFAAGGGYAFKAGDDGTYNPNDTGVNNRGALAGAEMLYRLIKEGVMPGGVGYADAEAAVAQGKAAMMIALPFAWDNLRKAGVNFGVAPLPTLGGKPASPFVGVVGAMVSRASPNRDLAVEFLENHMLTVAGLKTINADVPLGTPTNRTLLAEFRSDPNIQATLASAQAGEPMPNNPEMGRFWSAMASALQNIVQGRQGPKDALDAAANRILSK